MKSYVECPNCNATHLLDVLERQGHTETLFQCSHCETKFWVTFAVKNVEMVEE